MQRLIYNAQITGVYGPFYFEDLLMAKKPTYEELEQRITELETVPLGARKQRNNRSWSIPI